MIKIQSNTLVIIFACFVIAGCGSGPIKLDKNFWKDKTSKIGIAIPQIPVGAAYKSGSQGLLDVAINDANASGLEKFLKNYNASAFILIQDFFVESLQKRGFKVKKIAYPFKIEKFKKFEAPSSAKGPFAEQNFIPVAADEGVDTLLLLTLKQFGTNRGYWGVHSIGCS